MSNRVASNPEQAIDLLAQAAARGASYDIAIIDLGLPGMDALELARAIRARAEIAKVRLVVLTASADIKSARDAGIDACLAKPVRQAISGSPGDSIAGQPQEAAATPRSNAGERGAGAGGRGNILLVEDNLSTSRWRWASCRSRATPSPW